MEMAAPIGPLDGLKFEKEPECWCGPDSVAKDPEPFREVQEGHFQLTETQAQELEQLHKIQRVDQYNLPLDHSTGFVLKGGSVEFDRKRDLLLSKIDTTVRSLYADPQSPMKSTVSELLKANNLQVYDLSNVEYNQADALRGYEELNQRIEQQKEVERKRNQGNSSLMNEEDLNQDQLDNQSSEGHNQTDAQGVLKSKNRFIPRNTRMIAEDAESDTVKLVQPTRSFAAKMAKFSYQSQKQSDNSEQGAAGQTSNKMIQETDRKEGPNASGEEEDPDFMVGFKRR